MARSSDKRSRCRGGAAVAAALALAGTLALSGTALAAQDELKGGSVVIQLQNSRGMKVKPKSITLPISGGAVDPVDGSGTVQVKGGFKAKRGRSKVQVKITTLTLGANGGQGSVTAKVNKDFVANFGSLTGGTVARIGWGATISNVRATIAGRGAKALNRAFSPKKRKGAKKSARGKVKGGQPLGTIVSITTDPRSVEVLRGGTMTLETDLGGTFASKLPQHCISLLGVSAIPPAEMLLIPVGGFAFPVAGGSAAPDFTAGEVITAGGQTLTKDNGLGTPGACASEGPPAGTELRSAELSVAFDLNSLRAVPTLPDGTVVPRSPLATIDFSTGTRSVDPATKVLTVDNARVQLADLAAGLLNQIFPNESGNPSNDFAAGDLIGTIDLADVKLR